MNVLVAILLYSRPARRDTHRQVAVGSKRGLVHFRVTFPIVVVIVIETVNWGNWGTDYDNDKRCADYDHED